MAVSHHLSGLVRRVRSVTRPAVEQVFRTLDSYAASGDYTVETLHTIREQGVAQTDIEARLYLASLYLQQGEVDSARELLKATRGSRQMKRYFAVLQYCREYGLPHPKLSTAEHRCIDYLSRVLKPECAGLPGYIKSVNGFSVVGNAPADTTIANQHGLCAFYFNDYRLNDRIQDHPAVHVVTPSWQLSREAQAEALLITGNSIFHRRSRVWQQFVQQQHYRTVYTVPQLQWRELSHEVSASPSAGLIVLDYLSGVLSNGECNGRGVRGLVAGFSAEVPLRNHSYDQVPASHRHNWPAEVAAVARRIETLRDSCEVFEHIA